LVDLGLVFREEDSVFRHLVDLQPVEEELPSECERVLRGDKSFCFNVELLLVGHEVRLVGDGVLFAPSPVHHRLRAVSAFEIYNLVPKPIHKRNRLRFVFKDEAILFKLFIAVEFERRFKFNAILGVFFNTFGFSHWRI